MSRSLQVQLPMSRFFHPIITIIRVELNLKKKKTLKKARESQTPRPCITRTGRIAINLASNSEPCVLFGTRGVSRKFLRLSRFCARNLRGRNKAARATLNHAAASLLSSRRSFFPRSFCILISLLQQRRRRRRPDACSSGSSTELIAVQVKYLWPLYRLRFAPSTFFHPPMIQAR